MNILITGAKSFVGMSILFTFIFNPRDLDAGQPMLKGLPAARKFKSYVGLGNAEAKLRNYLKDFSFTDIATADQTIDWSRNPVVKLS